MKILLTGSTGYIAQRLLPVLLASGHEVICCVRDKNRFNIDDFNSPKLIVVEADFLDKKSLFNIPGDFDVAYYLIHSMSSAGNFSELEQIAATNFKQKLETTKVKQVIYLSGIVNEKHLSKHLLSRKKVESILSSANFPLTTLRAGIIIGSGSASFEIMRDLVEKLPVMIAPKWLHTKAQPISIRNVIEYLAGVLLNTESFDKNFDIGGPDVLSYKKMLLRFAKVRLLKRYIFVVPVMTPRLSSYWLYFVTSTTYKLAVNLVDSMKIEVVCKDSSIQKIIPVKLISYEDSIKLAFDKIEQNLVISSWKDALTSNVLDKGIAQYIQVPTKGCFIDIKSEHVLNEKQTLKNIWSIGGKRGWYYADTLWNIRGIIDKITGGVGLRRGRRSPTDLRAGETLDFWRVLLADKNEKRLLLYAEMKLPGEAWLEFKINDQGTLIQTATFRPLGLAGRFYWYAMLPFHVFIFRGMIRNILSFQEK